MTRSKEERDRLRQDCSHAVGGFRDDKPAALFEQLAQWCAQQNLEHDNYGEGRLIAALESKVAALLGKPSALYLPSGVMAQLIALRLHTERRGLKRFGMHLTSHLEQYEEKAYQAVFDLQAVMVGDPYRPITLEHLNNVKEQLACLLIELPMREIGGQLPSWEELEALKAAASQRNVTLHMDGARLWESRAFYQRSYAEIAAGFESVYVSLYKGIGALSGAVLAGDAEFIAAARVWRRRMGGTIVRQTPMIASAMMQLDQRVAMMEQLYQRTLLLAKALNSVAGIKTLPEIPQSNMLHVIFDAAPDALLEARDRIAEEEKIWLVGYARQTEIPGVSRTELYIGDHALELSDAALGQAFTRLMQLAREVPASEATPS